MHELFILQFFSEEPVIRARALIWVVIVMFSICLHELAHAWVALKHGDDTATQAGHLSLNPTIQMGPYSLLLLAVLGLAWGAVPVDEGRMRSRASGAWVAAAGPLTNLALMVLFAIGWAIADLVITFPENEISLILIAFYTGTLLNALLFILNSLPIPMLDGWRVFGHFYPRMLTINPHTARQIGYLVILMIFIAPPLNGFLWGNAERLAFLTKTELHSILQPVITLISR